MNALERLALRECEDSIICQICDLTRILSVRYGEHPSIDLLEQGLLVLVSGGVPIQKHLGLLTAYSLNRQYQICQFYGVVKNACMQDQCNAAGCMLSQGGRQNGLKFCRRMGLDDCPG